MILKKQSTELLVFALILSFALAGCTGAPTYQPEVGGKGAISSQGGVVYSIPANNPVIKMKLVSMLAPKEDKLYIRMYFLRSGAPGSEYLDPKEQSISLPDTTSDIAPSHVYASAAGRPMIRLADNVKQTVEMEFPVPPGGHQYSFIKLNWKIHYKKDGHDKTMAQTERFDYVSKVDKQGASPMEGDVDFPYQGVYGPAPAEWEAPGWMWW